MITDAPKRPLVWVVDDSPIDAERARRLLSVTYAVEVMGDGAAALERLAGGGRPDLLLLDWVMPGISGLEVCRYVRASPGRHAQIPIILLTANNEPRDVLQAFSNGANDYVSKPFLDEELNARVKVLVEGKLLLDRALKAEADLQALIANAPDPIFAVDAQGKISFANEEALRILERPGAAVLDQNFHETVPGISLNQITVGPGESLLPLTDVQIGERVFSPSLRILPSDSAATTTVGLRDVTIRRQTDARRLDFYSVIAHDLRTPITAILLRLTLAFRGKHGVLPAGLLDDLHNTERSLRSLLGMINDFLELAKLEGVGYKIDRQAIDLQELFRTIAEDFQPLFEKKQISWETIGLEAKPIVQGSPQRLSQVLSNLIGNSLKFNSQHGRVIAEVRVTEDYTEISIRDTGRGIDPDELPHLFKRFARAAEPGDETPGTGLGLMIVREIVEAHGGTIGAESTPQVGSRFWFRLPHVRTLLADPGQ